MIFVDTWAWVALADRRDPYHARATLQHKEFQATRLRYVTTDYVFNESATYLYYALPAPQAEAFLQAILDSADAGKLQLVHVSAEQFRKAWELRKKYDDKPDISFVDFTSFIVMRDLGLSDVFSGDAHFEQVGMGFRLLP